MSKHLKILLGGSPCTHWSIAQSKNRETTASGIGWELFENYLYARDKFKPDYFLYENNKSAAQPIKDQISKELGVNLQYINSALVSAQNRQRFYGHNIPGVPQPQDRGILLRDVLDNAVAFQEKSYCLDASYYKGSSVEHSLQKHVRTMVAELIRIGTIESGSQGGGVGTKTGLYACPIEADVYGKSRPLQASYYKYAASDSVKKTNPRTRVVETWSGQNQPVYIVANGLITIKDKQYPIKLPDGLYIIRKLTVNECRRLQTIPDWYKMPCSASQNYKMLGNGWTVEVIKHILSYIPDIANCTVEVLSMYDGMSCGQIALTELGCKINRYVSYEIDKYCIQTTQMNFPKTEQRGDAFQLRNTNWNY